eukprot:Skav219612  [mRNA]  locus=scaffold628:108030:110312:- [translate_table: standard]
MGGAHSHGKPKVTDDQGEISDDALDFIVPNPNGILAFQSGFNTRVASNLEEPLWQKLSLMATQIAITKGKAWTTLRMASIRALQKSMADMDFLKDHNRKNYPQQGIAIAIGFGQHQRPPVCSVSPSKVSQYLLKRFLSERSASARSMQVGVRERSDATRIPGSLAERCTVKPREATAV